MTKAPEKKPGNVTQASETIGDKQKEAEKDENNIEHKEENPKKVMPPKPWLMKKSKTAKRSLKVKDTEEPENITNKCDDITIDILLPPTPCKIRK